MMTRLLTLSASVFFLSVALVASPLPATAQEGTAIEAPSREKAAEDSLKAHAQKDVQPAKETPGAKRDETHTGRDPITQDTASEADAKPISPAEKTALVGAADAVTLYNPNAVVGAAEPWQLYYQPAAAPVMTASLPLSNYVLALVTIITLFVMVLMIYVIVRFSRKNNPVPQTFTHNKTVEIIWTVIPILLLVSIAIPSLRLHYNYYNNETIISEADLTLKVVGHQWYWSYEYPDEGIAFDSNIKADADLAEGEPRLLAVDNPIVVPIGKTVRVQITSADVIHAWAMPSFGIKQGAVPGRLNETWFKAEREGIYYGQCSVLCGKSHGFMPIEIRVVSEEQYAAWVRGAKLKFAANGFMQFASIDG